MCKEGEVSMLKMTEMVAKTAGLPPGTPVFVGTRKTDEVKITVIDYDQEIVQTQVVSTVEEVFPYKETSTVTWINVDGIHNEMLIENLSRHYGLHPLVIEDILNTHQRIKIDVFDNYLFVVLKMYVHDEQDKATYIEQVSLLLGENFVLTFQEREGDVFDSVRDRLKHSKGRIRKVGADYLLYALFDAIVDSYFEVLEHFGEQIEAVEEELTSKPNKNMLKQIHALKRELIFFRRSVWPLRNVLNEFERQEMPFIQESTKIYLRDLYDHVIQVIETIEIFRDMMSGILDVYLSSISNKMNEVMQFLTIIGTIFIPLTFVAGIYGMNFQYMPELTWKWGYFAVLVLMAVIGGALLCYFRKKKWL